MVKSLLYDIDLVKNRLLNARLHPVSNQERANLGTTLNHTDEGFIVYDKQDDTLYIWNGTSWIGSGNSMSVGNLSLVIPQDSINLQIDALKSATIHSMSLDRFPIDTYSFDMNRGILNFQSINGVYKGSVLRLMYSKGGPFVREDESANWHLSPDDVVTIVTELTQWQDKLW